jgi:hypothetical protein
MTRHEYKGITIYKRSGNSARRGYKKSGYAMFVANQKVTFETLKDAKAFVDANAEKAGA